MRFAARRVWQLQSPSLCCSLRRHAACTPTGVARLLAALPGAARPLTTQPLRFSAERPLPSPAAAAAGDGVAVGGSDGQQLELPDYCSGCGVKLQQGNPDMPGFFQVPKKLLERQSRAAAAQQALEYSAEGDEAGGAWGAQLSQEGGEGGAGARAAPQEADEWGTALGGEEGAVESTSGRAAEDEPPAVLCARCYSLRNYGQVKSNAAEMALPDFDMGRKVGRKIALTRYRRSVLLCVVDVTDFDGSLPRLALRAVMDYVAADAERRHEEQRFQRRKAGGDDSGSDSDGAEGDDLDDGSMAGAEEAEAGDGRGRRPSLASGVKLVLAVNKVDLLPKQVTRARLEHWVRRRAKQGGVPRPTIVPLVSSVDGRGVAGLLDELLELVGSRGDVWVIGAQNAGKSSMINALRRAAGLPRASDLTTAVLPGTTLGMLRVKGVLGSRGNMYDTPGVPHAYQLTSQLNLEEVKMVLPSRPLKARTYRAGAGQSILIGGLARVDVLSCPSATMYLTVWVSDDILCHFGRTNNADERYEKHAGVKLTPPLGQARLEELGPLVPTPVNVAGTSWTDSTVDVALSGLGWVSLGVNGGCQLRVWTLPGVAITTREALIPDYAAELERPGFGVQDKRPTKGSRAVAVAKGSKAPAGGGGGKPGAKAGAPKGGKRAKKQ